MHNDNSTLVPNLHIVIATLFFTDIAACTVLVRLSVHGTNAVLKSLQGWSCERGGRVVEFLHVWPSKYSQTRHSLWLFVSFVSSLNIVQYIIDIDVLSQKFHDQLLSQILRIDHIRQYFGHGIFCSHML